MRTCSSVSRIVSGTEDRFDALNRTFGFSFQSGVR